MRTNRGFTLIELLVVIAIIGILSSVVLASLNSAREKSRDAKRIADVKQLQLALELYFDSNGEYPDALGDLETGGFIPSEPTDPTDGTPYPYTPYSDSGFATECASGTTCISYQIGAELEQSGHTALGSDADEDGATGTAITSGADGTDCTGGAGRYCYDLTP